VKNQNNLTKYVFTKYEIFLIAILAIVQFTVVLDFMVLSPLGAILMRILSISPGKFSTVVAAYALSAGAAGFIASGFADKFDRKKLLVFFYSGFVLGTLFCGIAPNYEFLLFARIFTGIFAGVMSSVSFAIITDLFPMQARGRVMGFVQMSFAVSQVLGIPVGIFLATKMGWHAPFLMIVAFSIIVLAVVIIKMKPVDKHLEIISDKNPFLHLVHTLINKRYLQGFAAMAFLAIGGFMLMPFTSAFLVNNIGISESQLPLIFMITGMFSMVTGPLVGRLSDKMGKYRLFIWGTILTMIMMVIYTNLSPTAIWIVVIINVIMFVGITARMISAGSLITGVPEPSDRGAFMSINSSIQQLAGGVSSIIGGMIISSSSTGKLNHFDTVGYIAVGVMMLSIYLMYYIHRMIKEPGIQYADETTNPEVLDDTLATSREAI